MFKKISIALQLLGLASVLTLSGHADAQTEPTQSSGTVKNSARAGLTVTAVKPEQSSLQTIIQANGSITAWQEAAVGVEVGGLRLADVMVNVGDRVKKDEVLAVLATETLEADLNVLRAQATEASAALSEAKTNAARAKGLKDSGALSGQQIGQYLTAEMTASARLQAMNAQINVMELRIKKARVLAPDDGEVISRQATLGSVVPAGSELFRIVRKSRLEWRAEVTSEELGRIAPGMRARVFPASLKAGATPLEGTVRMIGPSVDLQSRTAIVYVDLPTSKDIVTRPGMFARGEFIVGSKDSMTLPQESIVTRDGFNYVFIIKPDLHVTQTKVTIGQRTGKRVEILNGISPSDSIAESGAGFLADGDLVNLPVPAISDANDPRPKAAP